MSDAYKTRWGVSTEYGLETFKHKKDADRAKMRHELHGHKVHMVSRTVDGGEWEPKP